MGLNTSGLIFIVIAFGVILGLMIFNFYKIFTNKKENEESRS